MRVAGRFRQAALAISAALALVASPAIADLKYSTTYKDNPVKGTTARQLWEYMIKYPIIDPDDGPAYANITHDHKLAFKVKTEGGRCRVQDLTFSWKFVITIPKALNESGMDANTLGMWREFTAYLRKHEDHHADIFVACGKEFVPAAEKMTGLPGCLGMTARVRNYVDEQYAVCMKKQRAFDREEGQTVRNLRLIKAAEKAGIKAPGF